MRHEAHHPSKAHIVETIGMDHDQITDTLKRGLWVDAGTYLKTMNTNRRQDPLPEDGAFSDSGRGPNPRTR